MADVNDYGDHLAGVVPAISPLEAIPVQLSHTVCFRKKAGTHKTEKSSMVLQAYHPSGYPRG